MSITVKRPRTEVIKYYDQTTSSKTVLVTDRMTDTRTPLVKTPRGRWRMPTSYERTVETGSVMTYNVNASDTWNHYNGDYKHRQWIHAAGAYGASGYYYIPSLPVLPAGTENDLVLKARNKLKNMRVNYSQAFGERKQTARLVGDSLQRIASLVRECKSAMRHPNPRYLRYLRQKWRRSLNQGDAFSYWLELQYGWKPLLSDVYGSVANLHEREKEAGRGVVTVKASFRDNAESSTRLADSANTLVWDFYRRVRTEQKAFIRLDFLQDNDAPQGTLSQLGITNPLELAWELLPWSFVADWFIPIGDYLSSLDATLGWDFKGGSLSSKCTRHVWPVNAVPRPPDNSPRYQRDVFVNVSGSGRQMRFTRKAYTTCPTPARPSLEKLNKSSHMHVANGIALVMSLITGGSRVR